MSAGAADAQQLNQWSPHSPPSPAPAPCSQEAPHPCDDSLSLTFEGSHRAAPFEQGVTGLNLIAVGDFSEFPCELHEPGEALQRNYLVAML